MVEKMVLKLVNQMEAENIIEKSNNVYYEYVLIIMAEHIIAVGTMLIIGMIFKQFMPTVIFLVFFLSLRKRTGGYHADKFWKCYLMTIITHIIVIQAAPLLSESPAAAYTLLSASVLFIEITGAVNHPGIDMDKGELKETKKAARLLVLIEAAVITIWDALEIYQLYVGYMSMAIILCAFLMCIAKIIKQEVRLK